MTKHLQVLFIILIFSISIHPWAKADGISDFEIEGMSVGDSALNFFSKKELEEYKKDGFIYEDKMFYSTGPISLNNFNVYDAIELHIKGQDSEYIIHSITGKIIYKDNYQECVLELEKILPDLKNLFSDADVIDAGEEIWTNRNNQKIKTKSYYLQLFSGDEIALECYDQPKERINNPDSLKISIDSKEFVEFLHTR